MARASQLSGAYSDAYDAIAETQLITNNLLEQPEPRLRREFDVQVVRAATALTYIRENGRPSDRELIDRIVNDYAFRLPEVTSILDAAIAGESVSEEQLPPKAFLAELRDMLAEPQRESELAAAQELQNYKRALEVQTTIILGVLFLGLPVMAGLLAVIRIFERRETAANLTLERLEIAALTDSLTGLGNHRAYQEELQREVGKAHESKNLLSLAVLDVDEFKEVNDTAGHARGDHILFQLGRLLREVCQPTDLRFRVGGDEFAVIMPGSDEEQARVLMERFRILSGLTGATVSIGVAQLEPNDDTEILREKADATLYTAKRRGRNRVCTFSGDNAEQKVVAQAKIQAVRDLLRVDRIDMAFQPVIDTSERSVVGYEALARIPAGYDLEGPQEAFEIAERIGHSHDLDLLCIREGLRRAPVLLANQVLFLNISPRTLEYAGFSGAAITNLVEEAGLLPFQVCFEITERSTAPIEVIQREASTLKQCGFKLALDDVGAGNSGLEMMRRLQVDFIKVDRSVLRGAMEKGAGRGVLLAIIVFASEAGAFVIAEGIETQEMLSVIEEMNSGPFAIQGIQGFVLGMPAQRQAIEPERLSA